MKKTLLIIIIVLALTAISVWWWTSRSAPSLPSLEPEAPGSDTTSAIESELQNIDLGDLDAEFQNLDADINSL